MFLPFSPSSCVCGSGYLAYLWLLWIFIRVSNIRFSIHFNTICFRNLCRIDYLALLWLFVDCSSSFCNKFSSDFSSFATLLPEWILCGSDHLALVWSLFDSCSSFETWSVTLFSDFLDVLVCVATISSSFACLSIPLRVLKSLYISCFLKAF